MSRKLTGRVRIRWRDTKTGRTGVWTEEPCEVGSVWQDRGEWNAYMWQDGNYACDCNRALYFIESQDPPCGSERFVIEEAWVTPQGEESWVLFPELVESAKRAR